MRTGPTSVLCRPMSLTMLHPPAGHCVPHPSVRLNQPVVVSAYISFRPSSTQWTGLQLDRKQKQGCVKLTWALMITVDTCGTWDLPSCIFDSIVFVKSATSSAAFTVFVRDDAASTYSCIARQESHGLALLLLSCSSINVINCKTWCHHHNHRLQGLSDWHPA